MKPLRLQIVLWQLSPRGEQHPASAYITALAAHHLRHTTITAAHIVKGAPLRCSIGRVEVQPLLDVADLLPTLPIADVHLALERLESMPAADANDVAAINIALYEEAHLCDNLVSALLALSDALNSEQAC